MNESEQNDFTIENNNQPREKRRFTMVHIILSVASVLVPIFCVYLGHRLTLSQIDYEHAIKIADNNMSTEDYLLLAEKYFKIKNYVSAASIYKKKNMELNPIALNNLGYMYENGILFEKDIEKASEYYEKAMTLGDKRMYENWIRFNINYPSMIYYDFIPFIKEAVHNNSQVASDFINSFIAEEYPMTLEDFFKMDNDDIIEVFKHQLEELSCDEKMFHFLSSDFKQFTEYDKERAIDSLGVSRIIYKYGDKMFVAQYHNFAEIEKIVGVYKQYQFFFSSLEENKTEYIYLEKNKN